MSPLDPRGMMPFAEAEKLDPFALDEETRRAAWDRAWTLTGQLVREIHLHGVAVTWPQTTGWGYADPERKPWRNVASLAEEERRAGEAAGGPAGEAAGAPIDDERGDLLLAAGPANRGNELPLLLLQRLLLALHAAELQPPEAADCWWSAAELLEELGYLAVTYAYSLGVPGELKKYFDCGFLLGSMHGQGYGYGDMHLGNVGYGRKSGAPLLIDPGGGYELRDPDDPTPRAEDLAVFRLECDFLQWHAAMLGYAAAQPQIAQAVFARFPEAMGP